MPKRNWGYYTALGTIALALVALSYVAYREFVGCNRPYDPPRYATSDQNPALQSSPLGQTKAYPQSRVKMVRCEEPQGEKEYELCQQRNTARASEDAVCVARAQYYLAIIGLAFIVGTFVANAVAGWGAKRAADVAKEALVSTQRPWVSVKTSVAGPLVFTNGNGIVELEFLLTNHGLSPAGGIAISARICFTPKVGAIIEELSQKARRQAEKVRAIPFDGLFGPSLFPKEDITEARRIAIPRDEFEAAIAALPQGVPQTAAPIVVGLISYISPVDRKDHQTGFMYTMSRITPMHDGRIPGADLSLKRGFIGGYLT